MARLIQEVLCITEHKPSRSTVRRHYIEWRRNNGIGNRCDNQQCQFHSSPLVWNGKTLSLILDHRSGNMRDNRPENLRLLCPNCDAQNAETRGGANAGRIEVLRGGSYHVRNRDGTQDAFAKGARFNVTTVFASGCVAATNRPTISSQIAGGSEA